MSDRDILPYGKQSINEEDILAVVDVLRSPFLTQGPVVEKFEKALCDYTGSQYAVAVSSGTAALHLACLSLSIGVGDRVWTTPISFVATANCALYCGAIVEFVDVDPANANICPEMLEQKLELADKKNELPKAVIVVHFAGFSCDMEKLHSLSVKFGFNLIEDGCHALGGKYRDAPVGSCQHSDITTFSFHPLKSITTGEGGAILTNHKSVWETALRLRHHGIERQQERLLKPQSHPGYHEVQRLGFNYRLSDIHAALGYSQLKRIDDFIAKRRSLAERYTKAFATLPLKCPEESLDKQSAWHLYVIVVDNGDDRNKLVNCLRNAGIALAIHYIPIYRQPYWQEYGSSQGLKYAESHYKRSITLPLFANLTENEQERVIGVVSQYFDEHSSG